MTNRPSSAWVLVMFCMASFGCATAAPQPPSVDVTGNWVGEVVTSSGFSAALTMTLQQAGANVAGDLQMAGAILTGSSPSGPVRGTVSGNNLSLFYRGGSGEFTVNGDQMTRTTGSSRWNLKRQ